MIAGLCIAFQFAIILSWVSNTKLYHIQPKWNYILSYQHNYMRHELSELIKSVQITFKIKFSFELKAKLFLYHVDAVDADSVNVYNII